MLLDKLLRNIFVHVEPFATCPLDTGWRLRLPAPPDVMLHFVLQGSGFVRLIAGEGPPDLRIACGVVNINYGDSLGLFQRLRDVLVTDLSAFPQIRSAFEALLAEHSNAREGSEALTQALMSQCLVYLLRHLAEQPDDSLPWLTSLDDPGLGQALDLIFDRPGDHHTVASLADAALMGRSSFAERFHDAFGVPPMKFLHDVRLRRAAEMFQRDPTLAVDQVAGRVGFTSRSHFSQEFKRRFGASPAAFRGGWLTPRTLG